MFIKCKNGHVVYSAWPRGVPYPAILRLCGRLIQSDWPKTVALANKDTNSISVIKQIIELPLTRWKDTRMNKFRDITCTISNFPSAAIRRSTSPSWTSGGMCITQNKGVKERVSCVLGVSIRSQLNNNNNLSHFAYLWFLLSW